jgi:hypothetical protein
MSDQTASPSSTPSATWLYALFTAWLFIGLALFQLFPDETEKFWLEESGPVETFSALGYFICASVAICWFGRRLRRQWYLVVVLLLMGMRELDFHSRFTTMGVFKLRFYTSDAVPGTEKLIVATLLLGLGVSFLLAVRREAPTILRAVRERSTVVIGVAWGIALAVLSKAVDGLPRKLAAIHLTAPDWVIELAADAEEILELGIPVMFMTALLCHILGSSRQRPALPGAN